MRAKIARHLSELQRSASLFGCMLFCSFVLGMVSKLDAAASSPWPDTVTSVVSALIVCGFAINRRAQLIPYLGNLRFDRPMLAKLLGASVACMLILHAYFWALGRAGVPMLGYTDDYKQAGWPVAAMFLMVSIMPAVFEELAFRGVIQGSLEQVFTDVEAWLIQAALFSVLHLMPLIFPSHFLMGLWFGWLRRQSKSLYPGMFMHGAWNALILANELYWS